MEIEALLLVAAIVVFVLAAIPVAVARVNFVAIGLALMAFAMLVPILEAS